MLRLGLSLQRTSNTKFSMETVSQKRTGVYIKSTQHSANCSIRIAVPWNFSIQVLFYYVELEISLHNDDTCWWILLCLADSAYLWQNIWD